MAASDYADRLVVLRGGLVVPTPAYVLALQLEARGFSLRRDGDALVVHPYQQLTADDCTAIRRHKPHLLLLVDYCDRGGHDAHLFTDSNEVLHA